MKDKSRDYDFSISLPLHLSSCSLTWNLSRLYACYQAALDEWHHETNPFSNVNQGFDMFVYTDVRVSFRCGERESASLWRIRLSCSFVNSESKLLISIYFSRSPSFSLIFSYAYWHLVESFCQLLHLLRLLHSFVRSLVFLCWASTPLKISFFSLSDKSWLPTNEMHNSAVQENRLVYSEYLSTPRLLLAVICWSVNRWPSTIHLSWRVRLIGSFFLSSRNWRTSSFCDCSIKRFNFTIIRVQWLRNVIYRRFLVRPPDRRRTSMLNCPLVQPSKISFKYLRTTPSSSREENGSWTRNAN